MEELRKSAGLNESGFERKCLLIINLCTELPLLDLPNIENIYDELVKEGENEKSSIKILGYFAIVATLW